jgi:hypothetical protein
MLQKQPILQILNAPKCSDARLDEVLEVLDELHTAASEGQLPAMTPLNRRELIALLRELVYTAEETIAEIEQSTKRPEAVLWLVEKGAMAERGSQHAINE